jgi:hypothetical protein
LITVLGIEEESIRNNLVRAISSLIGIAAVAAKGEFPPIGTELATQTAIWYSQPDVFKSLMLEMAKDIFFFRIIGARTNCPTPMDNRVIPNLFAGVPSDPNHILAC